MVIVMALFRFEIKSDKKKSANGQRISAKLHAEYIDRKGRYKDVDQRELERAATENVISGPNLIEHQPGREILLYSSPFGVIRQDDAGIKISKGASMQTIATALLVAQNIYGDELSVHGNESFRQDVAKAAYSLDLPIHFTTNFANDLKQAKEDINNERREFEAAGGRTIATDESGRNRVGTGHQAGASRINQPLSQRFSKGSVHNQSNPFGSTITEKAQRGFCVPTLSGSTMDVSGRNPDVLLSKNEYDDLQRSIRERHETYPELRWDVSGSRRTAAKLAAEQIMHNLQSALDKTFASSHVQYINRETRFKQRGGCMATGNHLPKWADSSAKKFFEAADKFESSNGERYKEIVFALPNELELSQQQEIVEAFLQKHLQEYYYAWAIHDKIGSMSNGEHHAHVHIMFSTRQLDDYEKSVGRTAEVFFSRASVKDGHPEAGGCKKAECWIDKNRAKFINKLRESVAELQNETLEKYGHSSRVDHRSLKARRAEALANGNLFLAELLDKVPEAAVGPNSLLNENSPLYQEQKKLRQYNHEKFQSKICKNILSCNIAIEKNIHLLKNNQKSRQEISHLLTDNDRQIFAKELNAISTLDKQIETLQSILVSSSEAIEQSMIKYMLKTHKEAWQAFKNLAQERKHWIEFKSSLQIQEFFNDELRKNVIQSIDDEIIRIENELKKQAPDMRLIFDRLQQPSKQKEIQASAGCMIFANKSVREKINTSLISQQKAIADLSKAYSDRLKAENQDNGYTADNISNILGNELATLYAQAKELREEISKLRPKVISPERAMVMAKNNYVRFLSKGTGLMDFQQLRKERRELEKSRACNKISSDDFNASLLKLNETEKQLEALCAPPEAQGKISDIVTGILQKNSPIAMKFAKLSSQLAAVQQKIDEIKPLHTTAKNHAVYSGNTRYKLSGGGGLRSSAPKIAAALAGDEKFTPLVLQSKHEDQEDWELLSEAEKDEIRYRNW